MECKTSRCEHPDVSPANGDPHSKLPALAGGHSPPPPKRTAPPFPTLPANPKDEQEWTRGKVLNAEVGLPNAIISGVDDGPG